MHDDSAFSAESADANNVKSKSSNGQSRWTSWVAGLFVAFLAWPIERIIPHTGIDQSWQVGLHLATHAGLRFGKDIVFTYGPYGFLSAPMFVFTWTGFLAFLYSSIVVIGFAVSVVHLGRRNLTLPWAVAIAYLALLVVYLDPAELAVVVLFLWCLVWATNSSEKRLPRWFPVWGGAIAALQLLVKFDTGLASVLIVGLTILSAERERLKNELISAGSFVLTFFVLWVAVRQPLGGIPGFFHRSLQVASGYSAAMGTEVSKRLIEYVAIGVVLFVVFPLILAHSHLERRRRPAVFFLLAVMTYTQFLHGFIRHDWYHATPFLIFAAVLPIAGSWKGRLRMVAAGCCAFPLLVALALPQGRPLGHEATHRPGAVFDQLRFLFDPSHRHLQIAQDRRDIRRELRFDATTLELVAGHEVAVDPWEISAVWALQENWRPFPVFQTYSAYTPALDELNAAFLASPSGPDRILRQPLRAIDNRYPLFESPAYELAMFCHFEVLNQTESWQVLGRIPDRCSIPSLARSIRAAPGQLVDVPQPGPGELIFVQIGLKRSLISRVLGAIFKPDGGPRITLDGASYRLIPGTASEPHVLCTPSLIGSDDYGGGRCPVQIAIKDGGPVTLQFYSVRLM